jgi:thiamine kinase-like enzyme
VDEQIRKLIQVIPELGGRSLKVSPLEGGLTNSNYLVEAECESFVLRVGGKDTALLGIDRACEAACWRAAADLGVGPEVRQFVPGRALTETDLREPGVLGRVVEALRRYHSGPPGMGSFSPFATVRSYYALARERRVPFPDGVERALEELARTEGELQSGPAPCPCHNDLLAGNLIDDGASVRIIDWEYGGMGDRFFDLGNLAVNNGFDDLQERALLALYFGDVRPEHVRRLRLMRLASDMREAMWGFLQAAISSLEVDYLAYGRKHLERFMRAPPAAE